MTNKEITIKLKLPVELTDLLKKVLDIDLDKTSQANLPSWINEDLSTFAKALKDELSKYINIKEENNA